MICVFQIYGGRSAKGPGRKHFGKASRGINRKILQQLEEAEWVATTKRGRVITKVYILEISYRTTWHGHDIFSKKKKKQLGWLTQWLSPQPKSGWRNGCRHNQKSPPKKRTRKRTSCFYLFWICFEFFFLNVFKLFLNFF